jgi:hypothetical protein
MLCPRRGKLRVAYWRPPPSPKASATVLSTVCRLRVGSPPDGRRMPRPGLWMTSKEIRRTRTTCVEITRPICLMNAHCTLQRNRIIIPNGLKRVGCLWAPLNIGDGPVGTQRGSGMRRLRTEHGPKQADSDRDAMPGNSVCEVDFWGKIQ